MTDPEIEIEEFRARLDAIEHSHSRIWSVLQTIAKPYSLEIRTEVLDEMKEWLAPITLNLADGRTIPVKRNL